MKFSPSEAQNASARCNIVAIDPVRSWANVQARWWGVGEDNRTTEWGMCIGPETLTFETQRDLGDEEPADARFA